MQSYTTYTCEFAWYGSLFCDKVVNNNMIAEKICALIFGSNLQGFSIHSSNKMH